MDGGSDCDDAADDIFPSALDACGDGSAADSQPCEPSTWYADTDGDGFGDVEATR